MGSEIVSNLMPEILKIFFIRSYLDYFFGTQHLLYNNS